jgi:hypothetical protein
MIRTFAQALTGNQTQVMEMLFGVNASINNLDLEIGKQLGNHVEKTGEFSQNPVLGIEKLKEMFDQTSAAMDAMDAMDNFRAKSVDAMGQNSAMTKEKLARADKYIVHTRQQQAREASKQAISGPVAL